MFKTYIVYTAPCYTDYHNLSSIESYKIENRKFKKSFLNIENELIKAFFTHANY